MIIWSKDVHQHVMWTFQSGYHDNILQPSDEDGKAFEND